MEDDGFLSARVEVVDTGPGIPQSEKEKIFQAFYQASGSSSRTREGAGLGLAICRNLVSAMGGEMGLQSSPGEGSTFWVKLRFAVVGETLSEPSVNFDSPSAGRE